ncbi:MAG: phospho-N-acetylmuramoyl-pentapeptide-transferase [Rickettsiales bacterium]|nr:phospho-N-acetylmuramoyl-pentapeptide-transferase [Rickettsiales bacterium]
MIYQIFAQYFHINIFRYITFRSMGAMATSFLIVLIVMPWFIKLISKIYPQGQPIKKIGPNWHSKTKTNVPTMGGIPLLFALVASVLLWTNLTNPYIWITLFVTVSLGFLGFIDDHLKVSKSNNIKGINAKTKLIIQSIIALIACFAIQKFSLTEYKSHVTIPFFKRVLMDLSYFYPVFVILVIVGSSNAVNLTDGLDGLVAGAFTITTICFGIICYLVGNYIFSNYLQIFHVPGSGELAIFCAALIGASMGFLWYNVMPASIFMGDVGSLSLGGAIGTISVITKHEFILAIVGGLFVIESLSVIMQVGFFKATKGKRIFLMAPLHHHFEKMGWTESQIVTRFWIIAIILALIGMATLKLR